MRDPAVLSLSLTHRYTQKENSFLTHIVSHTLNSHTHIHPHTHTHTHTQACIKTESPSLRHGTHTQTFTEKETFPSLYLTHRHTLTYTFNIVYTLPHPNALHPIQHIHTHIHHAHKHHVHTQTQALTHARTRT